MNRQPAIASIALMLALAGCTGPVTPDELGTNQPTVAPETPAVASVAGTTWGDMPFIQFNSDGTLIANAGCNDLHGGWEQEGATVTFGVMREDPIGCDDSPDWANFPVTATVTDESITLLDADGAVIDELAAQN